MISVPMRHRSPPCGGAPRKLDRWVGGSTGTNIWGACELVAELKAEEIRGSVVTLLCDDGRRYAETYYSDGWVADRGWDLAPPTAILEQFMITGRWPGVP